MGARAKSRENSAERQLLTGMIVSTAFLRQIAPLWDDDFVEIPFVRRVGGWCMDYFEQYSIAPASNIEAVFRAQERAGLDPDEAELISDFLDEISDQYSRDEFNADYALDQAVQYFQHRSIVIAGEDALALASQGKLKEAEEALSGYRTVSRTLASGVDLLSDVAAYEEALAEGEKPLFHLPGAIGELMNGEFYRGGFMGIMAPEKTGKTWTLQEISLQAARQGCNVAMFGAGDMTSKQYRRRYAVRLTRKNWRTKFCGKQLIPVLDCFYNQCDNCERAERSGIWSCIRGDTEKGEHYGYWMPQVYRQNKDPFQYQPCTACSNKPWFRGAIWWQEEDVGHMDQEHIGEDLKRSFRRYKGRIKLDAYPSKTLNVSMMRQILRAWEDADGFVPDLIMVDYADIMRPEPNVGHEFRHQVNETWMALRGLAAEKHALVITPTQADADSYGKTNVGLKNFSEDKRKYSHVTSMFALNQTAEEKKLGILRIGALLMREDEFSVENRVAILQALKIGNPMVASFHHTGVKDQGTTDDDDD